MKAMQTLTTAQLAAVYNHHTDKPVKRFENQAIGRRRLKALLAKVEVSMPDAIAATFPVGYGDKLEEENAADKASKSAGAKRVSKVAVAAVEPTATNSAKTVKARRPVATQQPAAPAVNGKARSLIVAAVARPEGATAAELFATTGWKFASWSHQMKLAEKATGWTAEIKKVDGVTRYFLTGGA